RTSSSLNGLITAMTIFMGPVPCGPPSPDSSFRRALTQSTRRLRRAVTGGHLSSRVPDSVDRPNALVILVFLCSCSARPKVRQLGPHNRTSNCIENSQAEKRLTLGQWQSISGVDRLAVQRDVEAHLLGFRRDAQRGHEPDELQDD